MEDHTAPLLDLSHAGPDIISMVLCSMPLRDRCRCALVCKAWAEAATAATHSIILEHRMQNLSSLQHRLEKHGNRLEVLQLHACCKAVLTALPCCAKLQDLLLHHASIASMTWSDIASATKLTSISLQFLQTASQQADVVAALTALPNLEQLTLCYVQCSKSRLLSDSSLLQQMMQLTSLELQFFTAAALQHLGSLTKLQHLSISAAEGWAAAGCPGLQELKALTSLKLNNMDINDLPTSVSQLTALRQLEVRRATLTALNQLQVLTGLTRLWVWLVTGMSPESLPLQLPGLQHLQLDVDFSPITPVFLASCTQLVSLKLTAFRLQGPGSLVASTMLQDLKLKSCNLTAADGAAGPVSWQQVFPGPGQLPHLTYLQLQTTEPALRQADIAHLVACCSSLKALCCSTLPSSIAPALARLPGLTRLQLHHAEEECSTFVRLTGLRQLIVGHSYKMSAVGLRQLAALNQLTSLELGNVGCRKVSTLATLLMKDKPRGCMYNLINKAPSGSPSDVSSRLLDICNLVDACEGLSIEAVIAAAERELKLSGPSGPSGGDRPKPPTAEALLAAAAALKAKGDL